MNAKMSGVSGVRWLIVNGEPVAHAIASDDPSSRGWRPLCQQSDIGNLLLRDARDGIDEFCGSCRTVYGSRMRRQQRRRRATP